jgi:hypothetical protein
LSTARECGPCSECCFSIGVHELDKRMFARCKHEKISKRGACSIYKTRPESCKTFSCLWLGGHFDRKDRPDRTGIVFATADMPGCQIVIAYVRRRDADKTGRGLELLERLAQVIPVYIKRSDGTKSFMVTEPFAHLLPLLQREVTAQAIVEPDGTLRRLPIVG